MARVRRRMSSRAESEYRTQREGDAPFYTSRALYDDLAVVIRRFPTRDFAPSESGPFVLVHGIGVSSRYFHPTAAELAKYGTVYLVDLPGYGSAPNPRRVVTIGDHAAVLARFLRAEGIDAATVVGHSMGTQVVSQLALDAPELASHVVLIAPTMDPQARTLWRGGRRLLRDIFTCEPMAVNLVVSFDYFLRCGIPYFLKQTKQLFADHIEDRLSLLTQKTLVLRGDRDCVSPEGWSKAVAGMLRHGSYATVPGPHVVMFTDPPRVAAYIADHSHA